MAAINTQFIISMLIIGMGYTLKRMGVLKDTDGEAISRIVFNLTLPALAFHSLSGGTLHLSTLQLTGMSFFYGTFMMGLVFLLTRREPRHIKGLFALLIPGFNIGLFAFPLVEAIFGSQGIVYLIMFDMGNALVVFGLCFIFGRYYSKDGGSLSPRSILGSLLRSIPFMAYMTALTLNLLGVTLPPVLLALSDTLAKANMPLSLLLLGLFLGFQMEAGHWRKMLTVLGVRYGLGAATGTTLYFLLPHHPVLSPMLLILFVLPISMTSLPYSVQLGYDRRFVGTVNNLTIVLSFFLLWLIALATLG